jgi:hypothetical protein
VLRQYHDREAPMMLALAGGTMNGVARALGSGGAPAHVLGATIAALTRGTPSFDARPVLSVRHPQDGSCRHGFSFAAGLVYRVLEDYYRRAEPGVLDAVRASLLPLRAAVTNRAFYRGVELDVCTGGVPWLPESPHTLLASVLDQPLLWFRPFGLPLAGAPAFHLAATSMRPGEIAPRLWAVFRGRCRHPRLRSGQVREVAVSGPSGFVIDGDLHPAERFDVRITLGPAIRFLRPATRSEAQR